MPFKNRRASQITENGQDVLIQAEQKGKKGIFRRMHFVLQKSYFPYIEQHISRLSVAKKFGFSYALAIVIPIIGTTLGLAVTEYYERQALQTLTLADEQQQLVNNLEKAVIGMQSHPQQILPILGQSIWLDVESSEFSKQVQQVSEQLSSLATFIETYPTYSAIDTTNFKELLKAYEVTTDYYTTQLDSFLEKIDPANLEPEEIPEARQKLIDFMSGESATKINTKFESLSEYLKEITKAAQEQRNQAINTLNRVQALRLPIVAVSMFLSAAIATLLALYTGRQIARPLKDVTLIARRVTQESDFDLRAPVTTEDEVGSLAISLNQLIKRIGEYTHQLEMSQHMLEHRVEERTEKLTLTLKELKQTQSHLIQTEKMSSLGLLVAGVAHEINNPVNFIFGNLHYAKDYTQSLLELVCLYQKHYQPVPEIQEKIDAVDLDFLAGDLPKLLSSMEVGTERIRKIVLSLRNFSRLDESEMKAVDLHEGIDSTLLILNNRLKHSIEVVKLYGNLPFIECYAAQLNQVFMNIIVNAIDALEESMAENDLALVLQNDHTHSKQPQIVIQTEKIEVNKIRVIIRDNGPGIPVEIRNKLFDPFFTTKKLGKGTGLGLSISYQIIEKHQGKIEVFSEADKGTKFVISLPIVSEQLVETSQPRPLAASELSSCGVD